jgi:hypothetical protein
MAMTSLGEAVRIHAPSDQEAAMALLNALEEAFDNVLANSQQQPDVTTRPSGLILPR